MSVGKAPVLTCPTNPEMKKQTFSIQCTFYCGLPVIEGKVSFTGEEVKKICKKSNATSVKW